MGHLFLFLAFLQHEPTRAHVTSSSAALLDARTQIAV